MSLASLFDQAFGVFASDVLLEPAAGGAFNVRGFLRGARPEELIGGADQATGLLVLSRSELDALSLDPRKYDRVTIGGRRYTIEGTRNGDAADERICLKCWVKG